MHGDMDQLLAEFTSLERCCLHEPQWRPSDVAEIVAWCTDSPEGYGSEEQVIVVQLTDRSYGILTSCADTTGHGCQCGSNTVRADSLHAVLAHLTDYELRELLES